MKNDYFVPFRHFKSFRVCNFAYLPIQDCFIVQIFRVDFVNANPANQVVLHPACYNFEIRGHMASDIPIITLHHAGFRAKFQNFVWV